MVFMVVSAITLSLKTMLYIKEDKTSEEVETKAVLASWVPVTFAVTTPIFFTGRVILLRRMTMAQFGICFNPITFTMMVFFIDNALLLIGAIVYWQYFAFDSYLFLMGTIGVLFDSGGLLLAYVAIGKGPGGPLAAFYCLSTIGVILIDSVRYLTVPSWIEIVGCVIGLLGALEFVIPQYLERIIFPCKK